MYISARAALEKNLRHLKAAANDHCSTKGLRSSIWVIESVLLLAPHASMLTLLAAFLLAALSATGLRSAYRICLSNQRALADAVTMSDMANYESAAERYLACGRLCIKLDEKVGAKKRIVPGLILLQKYEAKKGNHLRASEIARLLAAIDPTRRPASEPQRLIGVRGGGDTDVLWVKVSGGPFEMSQTEVTFEQYMRCVNEGSCSAPSMECLRQIPLKHRRPVQPVACVAWHEARRFATWVGGRLPSEAEWELAARGPTGRRAYPWGDAPVDCGRAVISDPGAGCLSDSTAPPCSKEDGDSPDHICDLAGNVWEWTEDACIPDDLTGGRQAVMRDMPQKHRVVRGGSFMDGPYEVRATSRAARDPARGWLNVGFRPVRGPVDPRGGLAARVEAPCYKDNSDAPWD